MDRIGELRIDLQVLGEKRVRRVLSRRQVYIGDVPSIPGCKLYEVSVGERRKFLVVRRAVKRETIVESIRDSIPRVPELKRWLDWKGVPIVSAAVELGSEGVTKGRLYNFLPMGSEARCPIAGYIDAPFFTDIDRRSADMDLPLNSTLIHAAAEACAAASLSLVASGTPITPMAVFDLVAWTGDQAGKLDAAMKAVAGSLREARVIPAISINDQPNWSSLSEVNIWPTGHFSVLKANDVALRIGAPLLSLEMDDRRIDRLKVLAKRTLTFQTLTPTGSQLAEWAEEYAQSFVDRKISLRTWSRFYEDLKLLYDATNANLNDLAHKSIFIDRSSKLRSAHGKNTGLNRGLFVRNQISKRKRSDKGVPFPPSSLARRYRFLHEKVTLRKESLDSFTHANLLHEYDPVEALTGLKSALGAKATPNRREEALDWSFRVWKSTGSTVDDKLRDAELQVPTITGWRKASEVVFSSSWTPTGRLLENYLFAAAEQSEDCRNACDRLLIDYRDWPTTSQDLKRDWLRFLTVIGVTDGLKPLRGRVEREGFPVYTWRRLLRDGKASEGLDSNWCQEISNKGFGYPHTNYTRKGEIWRFPGQLEHDELSDGVKEEFSSLVIEHLRIHGNAFFDFQVGRFERNPNYQDVQTLPTPIGSFLRSRSWVASNTRDGVSLRRPNECWGARERSGRPPRFMDRMPETAIDIIESDELGNFVFSEEIGLLDWQSNTTAVARLISLAAIASDLASRDRPRFREEYKQAWSDLAKTETELPAGFQLTANRRGQLELLIGNPDSPLDIAVAKDAQDFESRVLSSAGRFVLEVGEAPIQDIVSRLNAHGSFRARPLNGMGVQLLVDGEKFVPSVTDPLLTSCGLDWLPEVLMIAHELRGEQIERGLLQSTLERKARAIRVRKCGRIALEIGGEQIPTAEELHFYSHQHDEIPTLILSETMSLDWNTLARLLAAPISRLIDTRLRSAESVLLKLAIDAQSDELEAPSDTALARALDCDIQTVQEHRLALRTDVGQLLNLLIPAVAFFYGIDVGKKLKAEAALANTEIDIEQWLMTENVRSTLSPKALIEACIKAADLAELRRQLGLDYRRFNNVLDELGEPTLSNEDELRQFFNGYLARMRPDIINRLRRHHLFEFQKGLDLTFYVEQKGLNFLPFNLEWVLTRESLALEIVQDYVSRLMDEVLGDDVRIEMLPFNRVMAANQKSVRLFAVAAFPVVRAWCRKNGETIPSQWRIDEPQTLVRHVENLGLLDFELIDSEQIPSLFRRTKCWPQGMAETLDRADLGLEQSDIEEEERRREEKRAHTELVQRSINFGGTSLDTGDASFAGTLQEIAEGWFSKDESWFTRSRQRPRLIEFLSSKRGSGGASGAKGKQGRRREKQLSEAQRGAMGLTSELLAFNYLKRRYPEYVDETSWVSENRARFFSGEEGDDSAGYDFRVRTPRVEWLYEVKSTLEDSGEFELTANELRVAGTASKDGRRRYRILYVPHVLSPDKWYVLELPNPMGERTRNRFQIVGRGSVRLKFERT